MARKKTKKKNPSKSQWIVLGIGGAIGLSLIGYGVYLGVKQKAAKLPEAQLQTWEYQIIPGPTQGGAPTFTARIYKPDGTVALTLPTYYPAPAIASAMAEKYIQSQGGTPIKKV